MLIGVISDTIYKKKRSAFTRNWLFLCNREGENGSPSSRHALTDTRRRKPHTVVFPVTDWALPPFSSVLIVCATISKRTVHHSVKISAAGEKKKKKTGWSVEISSKKKYLWVSTARSQSYLVILTQQMKLLLLFQLFCQCVVYHRGRKPLRCNGAFWGLFVIENKCWGDNKSAF